MKQSAETVAKRTDSIRKTKALSTKEAKYCSRCDSVKPRATEFGVQKRTKADGSVVYDTAPYCLQCTKEYQRYRTGKYRDAHWEEIRKRERIQNRRATLKRGYGITPEDYDAMYESQDGRCAICGKADPGDSRRIFLEVDHCHESLEIRGLLCGECNRGLGQFRDDPESLRRAIEYLAVSTKQRDANY